MPVLHPECTASPEGSRSPSPHILDLLNAHKKELLILPQVAVDALKLIKEPEADVREVSQLLERDLQLTTDILRIANSPAFGGCRDISRLSDAVVRMGLRRCKDLILTSCTDKLLKRVSMEQHWIRDSLWRHSYATGICCQILNASFGLRFTGEEFTAGLIHDIGRLLLAVIIPAEFSEGDPMDFDESRDPREREYSVFNTDHAELGSWFVEESGLPYSLVDVIRHHHAPEQASRNAALVALVAVADRMSNHFLRYESPDDFELAEHLRVIPHLSVEGPAMAAENCRALMTLAWNRVQNATDLS